MDSTTTASPYPYPLESLPMPSMAEPAFAPARTRRLLRWTAIALTALMLAAAFLVFAFAVTLAWAISHPPVAALASNPMLARHLAYEDVTFASSDGRSQVNGWWIPAASQRAVVLSHGYGTNREEEWVPMYDIAAMLHGLDYNVLMFDYGYADSQRRQPATGGVTESKQLLGALQFARGQGSSEIVVWGFSMGAGTALQAALQTDLIDGMILDSTFIPDEESIYYNLERYAKLPKRLTVDLIGRAVPMFTGTSLEQIPSKAAQSTAFKYPVLVIYGTADDKSPAAISERIAAAQKNPLSQLWIVPGAIHEMSFRMDPEEYRQRTSAFLRGIDEQSARLRLASADAA